MAQVAETLINKGKFVIDDLKCYISIQNNNSRMLKQISDHIIVFVCVPATCATYCTSGTNYTIPITHQKLAKIFRNLVPRVIHGCRFQICSQISHINNIFVVI